MYGEDYHYAATRLAGTIVRTAVNGNPVRVDLVNDLGNCHVTSLVDGKMSAVPLTSLDLTPVKLGYVNNKGKTAYISRIPKRGDYKQGLRLENSHVFAGARPPDHVLVPAILGQYPTFKTAWATANRAAANSCAWHRHWAIASGGFLLYKFGTVVGSIEADGNFVLRREYSYLKEYLTEVLP